MILVGSLVVGLKRLVADSKTTHNKQSSANNDSVPMREVALIQCANLQALGGPQSLSGMRLEVLSNLRRLIY
jgi:hypothetical protein